MLRRLVRSWPLRILFAGLLAFAAIYNVQPLAAFDVLVWLLPGIVFRVDTQAPLVALSFDDGPAPDHTPEVLQILERYDAHATFFLIGDRAQRFPDLVARLRQEGHEIGNHDLTLRSRARASDADFVSTLKRTEEILGLQGPLKLYRPPGGLIRPSQIREAHRLGYTVALGSAYPYDPSHPSSAYIEWLVTKNLAPGVIVILHDGIADPSRMIAALPGILQAGEARGFRFVTIGALLAHRRKS
jgi:peptidoglycan/xylan/chitin deacetylase (PgdA/CDA1 family)